MHSTEIANLRSVPQKGEPDDVLQSLSSGYVRVPNRALLLPVLHGLRARVQAARNSATALEKIYEVSNDLGPVGVSGEFFHLSRS